MFDNPSVTDCPPPFAFTPAHAPCLCNKQTCNFDVLYAYLTCGNYDCAPPLIQPRNRHSHTHTTMIAHTLLFAFPVSYDKSKNLRAPRRRRIAHTALLSVLLRSQARAATSATP